MEKKTLEIEVDKLLDGLKESHTKFTTDIFEVIKNAYKLGYEHGRKQVLETISNI